MALYRIGALSPVQASPTGPPSATEQVVTDHPTKHVLPTDRAADPVTPPSPVIDWCGARQPMELILLATLVVAVIAAAVGALA